LLHLVELSRSDTPDAQTKKLWAHASKKRLWPWVCFPFPTGLGAPGRLAPGVAWCGAAL